MDAGFSAHLRVGDVSVDERDAALLRAVEATGSLRAAADDLGRSYSRAHARLRELEDGLGPLVERTRGGADGGGSELTDEGRALLARFARLQAALDGVAGTDEVALDGTVRARDGDLATVETAAGEVRALLAADADAVQVVFSADAVTLHAPGDAPPDDATSARNRFEGEVRAVEVADGVATVRVAVGPAAVPVLVTADSCERLGLEPGAAVVATVKATATRATPR